MSNAANNTVSSNTHTSLTFEAAARATDNIHFVQVVATMSRNGVDASFNAPRMPISLLTCHEANDVRRFIAKHTKGTDCPTMRRIMKSLILETVREYVEENGSDNTRGAFLGG